MRYSNDGSSDDFGCRRASSGRAQHRFEAGGEATPVLDFVAQSAATSVGQRLRTSDYEVSEEARSVAV
jgi:hypothetical protein